LCNEDEKRLKRLYRIEKEIEAERFIWFVEGREWPWKMFVRGGTQEIV
jgi:hypothetical protein